VSTPARYGATLSLAAIEALCERLGLPAPVPLGGEGPPRAGGPADVEDPEGELAGLVRLAGGDDVPGELVTALSVLADPQFLITALRQDDAPAMTTSVAVGDGVAAELRPVGARRQRLELVPASGALARATAFCGLRERPIPAVPPLTLEPARLVAAGDRVAGGDTDGAAEILAVGGGDERARGALLRALVSRRAGCEVSVLDRRRPDQVQATVTAWLDAGDAGLWRIPPVTPAAETVEVRPVTVAELVGEMVDGMPELGGTP
jgi:hypothetical protein